MGRGRLLSSKLTDYIRTLRVGQGLHAGEYFELLDWQEQFLIGTFATGVFESALTIARGNGKTTLMAAVAAAAVDHQGPLFKPMSEILIVAATHRQAQTLFRHMIQFLQPRIEADGKRKRWAIHDGNEISIRDKVQGQHVVVAGAGNPSTLHGLAPSLIILDEVAQWPRNQRSRTIAAARTSMGKIEGCRMIWIGTRPDSPNHPFSAALRTSDYTQIHAAPRKVDLKDMDAITRAIDQANPSLPHLPDLDTVICREYDEAMKVGGDPLASFKALRLNMGTRDADDRDLLVPISQWEELLKLPVPDPVGKPVWGIDLGGSASMSALMACWPNGRLDGFAMFGSEPDIHERAIRDQAGTAYERAMDEGTLLISDTRIPQIAKLFEIAYSAWGPPSAIVCDRWRVDELRDQLEQERGGVNWQKFRLIVRGMGFKDGADAVRAFRRAVALRLIYPVRPLLLTSAISEAVVICDPAGNQKLAKDTEGGRRRNARDDAACAAMLAVEHGLKPDTAARSRGPVMSGLIG